MNKYILSLLIFAFFLTACSSTTQENSSNTIQKQEEFTPTAENRDQYLRENEYITEFQHSKDRNIDALIIKMNGDFSQKKISEQYLYLIDFFDEFNKKYQTLYDLLGHIEIHFGNNELPSYIVYQRSFDIVAANVAVDREVGQKLSNENLNLLDTLDKTLVLSGNYKGLTLAEKDSGAASKINQTIITTSGEVKGALSNNSQGSSINSGTVSEDTQTNVNNLDGNSWVDLTENQKFHVVSNALYSLEQNGYTIEEDEAYYIEAIDSFYTDSSTMDVPVNEALIQIGIMSNTIR